MKPHPCPRGLRCSSPTARRAAGFSLIELLVSMVLGLVVVLAITGVLVRNEGSKRTTTTVNDMNQTGAYLSYLMDRTVRSSGSGYAQRWRDAFGCAINATRSGTQILPRTSAFPAPFASVSQTMRLAPVVIGKNQSAAGSDVLMVMTGTAGYSESPLRVLPASVTSAGVRLTNTLGNRGDDLVLLAEDGVGCMLQQVTSGFTGSDDQDLPLSGTYYSTSGSSVSLTSFGTTSNSYAIPLGNAVNNPPQFQLIGVGSNATLFSYDLLRIDGSDAPIPLADGVVELRALYGVDTNGDGRQDSFADPGSTGYTSAELLAGTATAKATLRQIVSVRVALVMRSPLIEKTTVSPASLTLFRDLDTTLQQTVTLSTDDRKRRYRVMEFTVPLRNLLLLPAS